MGRRYWYARQLAFVVGYYVIATLVSGAIYILFRDSLTRTQLYVASLIACLVVLLPVALLARRAFMQRPNRFGRDVE